MTLQTSTITATCEFRPNCGLVIFVNTKDERVNRFADSLHVSSQIEWVKAIRKYDEKSAIICDMKRGYDETKAKLQIAKCFELTFAH